MKIPGQHNREPALQGEAMTPMIDVVFLLLVFFVCASAGQIPDVLLPAELAAGTTETEIPVEPTESDLPDHMQVIVRLQPGEVPGQLRMLLNAQEIPSAEELRQRLIALAAADPLTRMVLDIDDQVSTQQFVAIYDLCQALDFQSISFAVRE